MFQAALCDEDVLNGIGRQRGVWREKVREHVACAAADPGGWMVHKRENLARGIGDRWDEMPKFENFDTHDPNTNFQRCPFCGVIYAQSDGSSPEILCQQCGTCFCIHCGVPSMPPFSRIDCNAHEPTCSEYRAAPGTQPRHVGRRLEEGVFKLQSKLRFCVALAESLQWPQMLLHWDVSRERWHSAVVCCARVLC